MHNAPGRMAQASVMTVGIHIYGKAFIKRFVLDVSKPGKFHHNLEHCNDRCPWVCSYIPPLAWPRNGYHGEECMFVHIGVGSKVARSIVVGNSRASKRGTSSKIQIPALFCLSWQNFIFITPTALGDLAVLRFYAYES